VGRLLHVNPWWGLVIAAVAVVLVVVAVLPGGRRKDPAGSASTRRAEITVKARRGGSDGGTSPATTTGSGGAVPLPPAPSTTTSAPDPTTTSTEPASSPVPAPPDHGKTRIALFGDSLSTQAGSFFTTDAEEAGAAKVRTYASGGTAPCDWLAKMSAVARQWSPNAVALQFSGDAYTPCMAGLAIGTTPYLQKYTADTSQAIRIFTSVGARVYLIGAPPTDSAVLNGNITLLNSQYASLAANDPTAVTFVNAGLSLEDASGNFTWTLPCLSTEPCLGPQFGYPAGTNVVRAPDGVHFCPTGQSAVDGVVAACSVYMSGAMRFGAAMFAPIEADFAL